MIQLVDRDHVRDLHDPGLECLNRVTGARRSAEDDGIGDRDHLDLALAGAHGLEEDEVLARRVEDEQCLQRRLGEPAEVAARAHRADEDVRVEEVVARRIRSPSSAPCVNGLDGSTETTPTVLLLCTNVADDRADQRRLAHAGRPGDADGVRAAGLGVEVADDVVRERLRVLDQRDRACERAPVAGPNAGRERLSGEVARPAIDGDASGAVGVGPRG